MNEKDIQFTLKFKNLAAKDLRAFQKQVKGVGGELRGFKDRAKAAAKEVKSFGDRMQKAGAAIRSAGTAMREAGANISLAIGAPLAAAVGLSVKAFSGFEGAIVQSTAIMGDVSDDMRRKMSAAARDVALNTTFSAEQAGRAFFFLASAGLDAEQSVAALPQVASFAQAGMFDMATATDLLTDAQSALGLTIRDDVVANMQNMARVSDVLVKANTLSNATVEQFSTSLTTEAGAALKSFGIDVEEGVAVLAAFADQGVKGQVAGTGLSRILRLMTAGAEKNAGAFSSLGVRVFDASGNINNMADIVADLENALGGMSDAQRTAALKSLGFSARVQGVLLPLLGTSEAIRKYEKELRAAAGTTEKVAEKQLTAMGAQLKLLRATIEDVEIELGEAFAPTVKRLVDALKAFVNDTLKPAIQAFGALPEPVKGATLAVIGLVVAFGPLLIALGTLTSISGSTVSALGILRAGARVLTKDMALLTAATLTNPWFLLAGAIVAVVALFVKFRNSVLTIGGTTARLKDFVFGAFDAIREKVAEVFSAIGSFLAPTFDWMFGLFGKIAPTAAEAWNAVLGAAQTVMGWVLDAVKFAVNGAIKLFELQLVKVKTVFRIIGTIAVNVFDILREELGKVANLLGPLWESFKGVFLSIGSFVGGIFSKIAGWAGRAFGYVGDELDELADKSGGTVVGGLDKLNAALEENAASGGVLGRVFKGVPEVVKEGLQEAEEIIKSDPLGDAWDSIGQHAAKRYKTSFEKEGKAHPLKPPPVKPPEVPTPDTEEFKSAFNEGFTSAFNDYLKNAQDVAKNSKKAFAETFQQMEDSLVDFVETGKFSFKDLGRSILHTFTQMGVKSLIGDVLGLASGKGTAQGGLLQGLGALGGAAGGGLGSIVGLAASFFSEGGRATEPTKRGWVPFDAFRNAQHLQHGLASSGSDTIPAMISPNEAVVPLTRNRAIPVESRGGSPISVTMNVTTPNPQEFGRSQQQRLAQIGQAVARAQRRNR